MIHFTTNANSCIESKHLSEEISDTKHIFIAKIMQTTVADEDDFSSIFTSKFKTLKIFKGSDSFSFSELSFSSSNILIPGHRYLVFTNNGDIGGCMNSTQYSSYPLYTPAHELLDELITDYIKTSNPINESQLCLAYGYKKEFCNKHGGSK